MAKETSPITAGDSAVAQKESSGGAWTDAERVALLISIVNSQGTIDWTKVTLPPGRTKKACLHAVDKFKTIAAGFDPGNAAAKPKATPRKRKAATADAEDGDKKPKPKARAKRTKKVVEENSDNGGNEKHSIPTRNKPAEKPTAEEDSMIKEEDEEMA